MFQELPSGASHHVDMKSLQCNTPNTQLIHLPQDTTVKLLGDQEESTVILSISRMDKEKGSRVPPVYLLSNQQPFGCSSP